MDRRVEQGPEGKLHTVMSPVPHLAIRRPIRSRLSRLRSQVGDRWRRVATLNPPRLANAVQLHRAFAQAIRRRDAGVPLPEFQAWPMSLSVEPTTACNLRCPECPSGLRSFTRPTGMLDPDRLARLLEGPEGLARELVYLNLYFQGEPYLHPGMDDLVAVGKRNGIYVSTSTNAHHLSGPRAMALVDSGIDRLIISIDGATQAAYSSYRVGGQLEKVFEGTRAVLEAKRQRGSATPHVVWQFLVVGTNEHQLEDLRHMAAQFGVDGFVVKTAQIDQPADGHPLLTRDPNLRRYDRSPEGRWTLRNPLLDQCWRMWQGAVITWDGQVVPCCFDKDATHTMGKAEDGRAFRQLWHSDRYRAFRTSVFAGRGDIDMCRNCSEGTQVWA